MVGEAETPGGGGVCLPVFAHAFGQKAKVALLSTRPSGEGDIFATLDRLSIERSSGACPPSRRSSVLLSSRPPDYESRGLRFSQKQKKKREKGFGDAIEQWDRSVVEIPWRRARSLERGGRGGGKSPAREANGSRWSPRADGAAERRSRLLRRKLLPAVVPVTPVVPLPRPPSTQACI